MRGSSLGVLLEAVREAGAEMTPGAIAGGSLAETVQRLGLGCRTSPLPDFNDEAERRELQFARRTTNVLRVCTAR